jgi:hypothetical protein
MGRRILPESLMKEAIDERDIEKFCWAVLEQSRLDLHKGEEAKVFPLSESMSVVRQLVAIMNTNRRSPQVKEDASKDDELSKWMKLPESIPPKTL